jgi:hypothetical protein
MIVSPSLTRTFLSMRTALTLGRSVEAAVADQLTKLRKSGTGRLTARVLQEFYVNVTLKIGMRWAISRLGRIYHHGGNDRARLGDW